MSEGLGVLEMIHNTSIHFAFIALLLFLIIGFSSATYVETTGFVFTLGGAGGGEALGCIESKGHNCLDKPIAEQCADMFRFKGHPEWINDCCGDADTFSSMACGKDIYPSNITPQSGYDCYFWPSGRAVHDLVLDELMSGKHTLDEMIKFVGEDNYGDASWIQQHMSDENPQKSYTMEWKTQSRDCMIAVGQKYAACYSSGADYRNCTSTMADEVPAAEAKCNVERQVSEIYYAMNNAIDEYKDYLHAKENNEIQQVNEARQQQEQINSDTENQIVDNPSQNTFGQPMKSARQNDVTPQEAEAIEKQLGQMVHAYQAQAKQLVGGEAKDAFGKSISQEELIKGVGENLPQVNQKFEIKNANAGDKINAVPLGGAGVNGITAELDKSISDGQIDYSVIYGKDWLKNKGAPGKPDYPIPGMQSGIDRIIEINTTEGGTQIEGAYRNAIIEYTMPQNTYAYNSQGTTTQQQLTSQQNLFKALGALSDGKYYAADPAVLSDGYSFSRFANLVMGKDAANTYTNMKDSKGIVFALYDETQKKFVALPNYKVGCNGYGSCRYMAIAPHMSTFAIITLTPTGDGTDFTIIYVIGIITLIIGGGIIFGGFKLFSGKKTPTPIAKKTSKSGKENKTSSAGTGASGENSVIMKIFGIICIVVGVLVLLFGVLMLVGISAMSANDSTLSGEVANPGTLSGSVNETGSESTGSGSGVTTSADAGSAGGANSSTGGAGTAIDTSITGPYDDFAQCLTAKGMKFYGTFWCTYCAKEKTLFGSSFQYINYVECSTPDGKGQMKQCSDANVLGYPTMILADGTQVSGYVTLETLATKFGCSLGGK